MKHFHGTPIGGSRVAQLYFAKKRFLMIPWKNPNTLSIAMEHARGFCVDNSAFSFWSNEITPDWNKYITWVQSFYKHPRFEFAIIPDVIDGDAAHNDSLIDFWKKETNGHLQTFGVPVWHLHEDISRIEKFKEFPYIAIGSSGQWKTPGTSDWCDRMDEMFRFLCDKDGYPRHRVHGLRMLSPEIIKRYPFYSCDSTNAVQNGRRTAAKYKINCPAFGQAVSADINEAVMSPSRFVKQAPITFGFMKK